MHYDGKWVSLIRVVHGVWSFRVEVVLKMTDWLIGQIVFTDSTVNRFALVRTHRRKEHEDFVSTAHAAEMRGSLSPSAVL